MNSKRNRRVELPATAFTLALVVLSGVLGSSARNAKPSGNMAAVSSTPLPVGTILPVKLEKTISVEGVSAGQVIEAKIMQDVPLPNHQKIHLGSRLGGTILSSGKAVEGAGVQLTLQFNKIEYDKRMIPMLTSLRAIASYQAVRAAQMSFGGADDGTPTGWADTVQIGGDKRFGDGGEVRNRQKQQVGKGVIGGVLVHVRANPGAGCKGPEKGDDSLQALWVFSADACGVYDLRGIQITNTGNTKAAGEITLQFEKQEMKLDASTGMLLRVVTP